MRQGRPQASDDYFYARFRLRCIRRAVRRRRLADHLRPFAGPLSRDRTYPGVECSRGMQYNGCWASNALRNISCNVGWDGMLQRNSTCNSNLTSERNEYHDLIWSIDMLNGVSTTGRNSLIQAYGLFWRLDEIDWSPGRGSRDWHLYGRNGANSSKIKVV